MISAILHLNMCGVCVIIIIIISLVVYMFTCMHISLKQHSMIRVLRVLYSMVL